MDFYRTYYSKSKFYNSNNKLKLELSKTNTNYYKKNKDENNIREKSRKILTNKNRFSVDKKSRTCSQNLLTNKIIKALKEIRPKLNKENRDQIEKEYLNNFHTEAIKIKIRNNLKFKSLFDDNNNNNYSSSNKSLFQSSKSNKELQKRLIDLKLKTNKKIFTDIVLNNMNRNTMNHSENEIGLKEKKQKNEKSKSYFSDMKNNNNISDNKPYMFNNNFLNYQLLSNDISKTHYTTMYFSTVGNKSIEKSISSIHPNNKIIDIKTFNNTKNNLTINNINPYNIHNNKLYLKYNEFKSETNYEHDEHRIPTIPNINNNHNNNYNISQNKIQSFITSINYAKPPSCMAEFCEKNLHSFHAKTRDFRYNKYFLFLKRNKLKKAKETKEYIHSLHDIDTLKLIKLYNLFKPYKIYLEKYLLFLHNTIEKENKENEKLKIIKNDLLFAVTDDRRKLLKIHKKFNLYLNDKFFLLCVKNSTLKLDLFQEEDKKEFEEDLQIFELLKNYINELSALDLKELGANRTQNQNQKQKKNNKNSSSRSQVFINVKEKYNFLNIIKDSHIHFKPRPIFQSVSEFYDYMKNSRNKIENLLMEDNKIGIELANLRDYVILNQEDINKAKKNILLFNNEYNKTNQILTEIKAYNRKLIIYRRILLNDKKMKIHKNITKKILEILNMIYVEEKKAYNKIIDMNNININKPLTALKELEKIIIFLIDFKNEQKKNNNKEYLNTVKKIEKNKRLLIIKQRKEDDETRIDKKIKKIIQKDMKILNINNRRINYQYKPSHFKKIVKEENPDKDKDDLDISY